MFLPGHRKGGTREISASSVGIIDDEIAEIVVPFHNFRGHNSSHLFL
jgi:hypothetical protein